MVSALHVHLVFVTKYRRGVFDERMLRSEYTGKVNRARMNGHFWSPSYFAASCGGAPLSIIRQYIEQQQRPT